jgi:hypothetical protein
MKVYLKKLLTLNLNLIIQGFQGYYNSNYQNQAQQYGSQYNDAYGNASYYQGYPQQEYYEGYEDYEYDHDDNPDLDEDDFIKMEELNREMGLADSPSPSMSRSYSAPTRQSGGSGSFVPAGAMPSQNGVLSPHAAEFWFPECRDCPCCKGHKHGCACCKEGGQTSCTHAQCVNEAHNAQVRSQLSSAAAQRDELPLPPSAATVAPKPPPAAPLFVLIPPTATKSECSYILAISYGLAPGVAIGIVSIPWLQRDR